MESLRKVYCNCMCQVRECFKDYRTICVLVILAIFVDSYTRGTVAFAKSVDYSISPWLLPFLLCTRNVRVVIYAGFLLLLCNVSKKQSNAFYILVRSGHISYHLGNLCYIMIASFCYSLFTMLIGIIMNATSIRYEADWGKVLGTLSNPSQSGIWLNTLRGDEKIIREFTVFQGMFACFVLLFLTGVFLGFLNYFLGILSEHAKLGIVVSGFFIMLDFVLQTRTGLEKCIWFSPLSWSNLEKVRFKYVIQAPKLSYCFGMLILLNVGLVGLILYKVVNIYYRKRVSLRSKK